MENHLFLWENSLQMAISNGYLKLPEGVCVYIYIIIYIYRGICDNKPSNTSLEFWKHFHGWDPTELSRSAKASASAPVLRSWEGTPIAAWFVYVYCMENRTILSMLGWFGLIWGDPKSVWNSVKKQFLKDMMGIWWDHNGNSTGLGFAQNISNNALWLMIMIFSKWF